VRRHYGPRSDLSALELPSDTAAASVLSELRVCHVPVNPAG
jgi:hypothetical protein